MPKAMFLEGTIIDYGIMSVFHDTFLFGTRPWNLGRLDIYSDFAIDFNELRYFVRVDAFPDLEYKFTIDKDDLLDHPEAVMVMFATVSAAYFMSLSESVPDHITLGEN